MGEDMRVRLTYPGVYIEGLPSRVRAVSTVSTSVTAFVGYTTKGPINQVVTITGFADFERPHPGAEDGEEPAPAVVGRGRLCSATSRDLPGPFS
jgi:phage tail sheath protein FI